jgi:hypothetical protein
LGTIGSSSRNNNLNFGQLQVANEFSLAPLYGKSVEGAINLPLITKFDGVFCF